MPSNGTRICADTPSAASTTARQIARMIDFMASLTRRREWSYLCGHPSPRIRECQVNRRQFFASLAAAAVAPIRPLPPVSWTCPMHPEVVDDSNGKCPICGMGLKALRLDLVVGCSLHLDA